MSAAEKTPLARLVLFLFCLALAGSALAGAHYYAVDLPQQRTLQAPENGQISTTSCAICQVNCKASPDYYTCLGQCELVC